MQPKNTWLVFLVLLLFAALSTLRHRTATGADLGSSYYGCRVLAAGFPSHLYSRDPSNFGAVADPVWTVLAEHTGFGPARRLHPYVQIPLWAFALEPLCTRLQFPAFNLLFLTLANLCFVATLWLIATNWAPRTFHPVWIALACLLLYLSAAYENAMAFTQTHIFFLFFTLLALALAERRRAIAAGALLAAAAAVKLTPAFLVLYWLLRKQNRAAGSFLLFSAAIAVFSLVSTGTPLNLIYLHNVRQISNMLLVSANNQSLAAVWMAPHYPPAEAQAWHPLPLPALVKLTSLALSVASVVLGGLIDSVPARRSSSTAPSTPPYGAAFALLGSTLFAALAWNHYFVLLLFPLLLLLDRTLRRRSYPLLAAILLIVCLNMDTASFPGLVTRLHLPHLLRAEFLSGLLCMAALLFAAQQDAFGEK